MHRVCIAALRVCIRLLHNVRFLRTNFDDGVLNFKVDQVFNILGATDDSWGHDTGRLHVIHLGRER